MRTAARTRGAAPSIKGTSPAFRQKSLHPKSIDSLLCKYVYCSLVRVLWELLIGRISYRWMLVRKGIVDAHVLEVFLEMYSKKFFNHCEVELRVNKYRPNVRLDYIWEALFQKLSVSWL